MLRSTSAMSAEPNYRCRQKEMNERREEGRRFGGDSIPVSFSIFFSLCVLCALCVLCVTVSFEEG